MEYANYGYFVAISAVVVSVFLVIKLHLIAEKKLHLEWLTTALDNERAWKDAATAWESLARSYATLNNHAEVLRCRAERDRCSGNAERCARQVRKYSELYYGTNKTSLEVEV